MKFSYNIDSKVCLWQRHEITIEAKTAKEADQLAIEAKNILHSGRIDALPASVTLDTSGDVEDSRYILTLSENGSAPSVEIYRYDPNQSDMSEPGILVFDNLLGLNKNL